MYLADRQVLVYLFDSGAYLAYGAGVLPGTDVPTYLSALSQSMYLPSVRRDIIAQGSTDPYITIFNKAALISKTWLDAGPNVSGQIFGTLIQSITSGQQNISSALSSASARYDVALNQATQ